MHGSPSPITLIYTAMLLFHAAASPRRYLTFLPTHPPAFPPTHQPTCLPAAGFVPGQVRELEGRERLERSRIEARLRLTAAAREADGQPPWRPRLERLAEARSLAPFEKKVGLHS